MLTKSHLSIRAITDYSVIHYITPLCHNSITTSCCCLYIRGVQLLPLQLILMDNIKIRWSGVCIFRFLFKYLPIFVSLQNGLNALHLAAKEGHKDLVEELLERGAPVDSSTKVDIGIVRYQDTFFFLETSISAWERRRWWWGGKDEGNKYVRIWVIYGMASVK